MKKLLTILVVSVYFVPVSFFLTSYQIFTQETVNPAIFIAYAIPLILMLGACILVVLNMVSAINSIVQSRCLSFRTVMIFKLCLVPFYIINFICWMIASMVFHIALVTWPMIPFIIAYTYFTMLGTSVYVITNLFTLRQCNTITKRQFMIHSLLQLVFTVDVIDSIYLAIKQKDFETTHYLTKTQN